MIKLLCAFLLYTNCQASNEFHFVELQEARIEYRSYFPGGYNYLISNNGLEDRYLDKGVNLVANTNFLEWLYWNNNVHSLTDKNKDGHGQFRAVGWEFALGARITWFLNVEYYHHSQHILDYQPQWHFPVEDAVQLKIILYDKHKKEGMFD